MIENQQVSKAHLLCIPPHHPFPSLTPPHPYPYEIATLSFCWKTSRLESTDQGVSLPLLSVIGTLHQTLCFPQHLVKTKCGHNFLLSYPMSHLFSPKMSHSTRAKSMLTSNLEGQFSEIFQQLLSQGHGWYRVISLECTKLLS